MPKICRALMFGIAVVFVLDVLLGSLSGYLLLFLGVGIIVFGFPLLKPISKRIVGLFFCVSLFLAYRNGLPLSVLAKGVKGLIAIGGIMAITPLFDIPLEAGNYNESLLRFISSKIRSERGLFAFIFLISHFFTVFMLNGGILLSHSIFSESIKKTVRMPSRFESMLLIPAFAIACLWSPTSVTMLVVSGQMGLSWSSIAVPGSVYAIVSCILLGIVVYPQLAPTLREDFDVGASSGLTRTDIKKILAVCVVVIGIIAVNILLDLYTNIPSASRTVYSLLLAVFCWTLPYCKKFDWKFQLKRYYQERLLIGVDVTAVFATMGLFSEVFLNSPSLLKGAERVCLMLGNSMGSFFFLGIVLLVFAVSYTGIHPLTPVTLLATLFPTWDLGFSTMSLAMCLISGISLAMGVSPLSAAALSLSALLKESSFDVSIKRNWPFALGFVIVNFVMTYILNTM